MHRNQKLISELRPGVKTLRGSLMKRAMWCMVATLCLVGCSSKTWKTYHGRSFQDSVYQGGPQAIPGRVQCAYYDFGGEGVAYHDADAINHGSGELNRANGDY